MKKIPHEIDSSIVHFTQKYLNLALFLEERYGSLEHMEFVGFTNVLSPEPLNQQNCNCKNVLYESPWGLFVFKHSNDTIQFNIGDSTIRE